jgi:hypothetical protein
MSDAVARSAALIQESKRLREACRWLRDRALFSKRHAFMLRGRADDLLTAARFRRPDSAPPPDPPSSPFLRLIA